MSSQRDGKRQVPAHFIHSVGVQQRTPNRRSKPSKEPNFSVEGLQLGSRARGRLETLARLEGLEEPARIRQALDGSRLLLVPQDPPVWRRASRPPSSSQQSSLL